MPNAKFDLEAVKKIVQAFIDGDKKAIWFSAPDRSVKYVISIFRCEDPEATNLIARGILELEEADFSHSHLQWSTVMDVYGLKDFGGINWYVKFTISTEDGKCLESVSFHPLEKTLKLANGKLLEVNYSPED